MEKMLGLLRVQKGKNLAVRDTLSSDPYVFLAMDQQKLRTRVAKNTCNPEWNDELTFLIMNRISPINLIVHGRDTFTVDDKMGDACVDIKPLMDCLKMGLKQLLNGGQFIEFNLLGKTA